MKTMIASFDQKESILRELASQNNGILTDIQVLTLNTALKEEKDDPVILSLQLKNLLSQRIEQFPVYGKMFAFPAFIDEIISFTKECILYHIDPDTLPSSSPNEEELRRIIGIALTLDMSEKNYQTCISMENVSLHYQFIQDMYHYSIFESLKRSLPYTAYPINHPSVSLHYALSARLEAEAIAQDICQKEVPCNIILTSSAQLPLYESVFARYNIPYSALRNSYPLHIPKVFRSLIDLGIRRDRASLLNALKYHAFASVIDGESYAFLSQTLTEASFPEEFCEAEDPDIFTHEIEQYKRSYQHAKEYYDSIKEDIEQLIHADGKQLLYCAFDILRRSGYLNDPAELQAASSMRQTIIECAPYIETNEDVLFLARCFESIKATSQTSLSDFCTITDLTHPVDPKKISYVVSCSGGNYPGVPVNTGLFDERYVEKIDGYPSSESRYLMYMSQLEWVKNSASEQLIYSHYTNDYQGREIQLSFEIENQYPDIDTKWNIVSLRPHTQSEHQLDEKTAHALFQSDGKITGSISTIERYFECPYSYFIQSGLKVRKKDIPSIDAISIGSIQHKILEDSVRKNRKSYADISEEEVRELVTPAFHILEQLHPAEIPFVRISKERLIQSMMVSLSLLNDFERNTSFEPEKVEYAFSEDITDGVHLNGVIDRIDIYRNELFRIIDYKSSSKTLSEAKVKAGSQLQLLTYLIIAEREFHLKPAGAYYFSLKEKTYDVPARKVSRNKVSETEWDKTSEEERMRKERRLCGWKFEDRDTEMDASGTHLQNSSGIFIYDLVEECIISLYDLFHDALLEGNISLAPRENACMFCSCKSICRFHSETEKTKKLVMEDIALSRKEK